MKFKLYAISVLSVFTVSPERKLSTVGIRKRAVVYENGLKQGTMVFHRGQISETFFF